MSCSNCGTENRAEAKFCDGCGAALARACPECGSVVRPQAKFCDECGSPLDGSQRAAENRSAGRPAEVPRGT
ncbi:MAG: zinc-ribbon domain-containing protein, partial [Actinobacteria bacterium]